MLNGVRVVRKHKNFFERTVSRVPSQVSHEGVEYRVTAANFSL